MPATVDARNSFSDGYLNRRDAKSAEIPTGDRKGILVRFEFVGSMPPLSGGLILLTSAATVVTHPKAKR